MKIWGEAKNVIKKVQYWGEVGIFSKKMGIGRYFSNEMGYLMHQIRRLQSLKWGRSHLCGLNSGGRVDEKRR